MPLVAAVQSRRVGVLVPGPEHLHSSYSSVPCRFRGTFTSEGQVYEFSINGGLHGTLRNVSGNEVYLLGCRDKCAKYSPFDMEGSD